MANYGATLKIGFGALLFLLLVGALASATDTRAQPAGVYDGTTAAQLTATRDAAAPPHTLTPTVRRTVTPTTSTTPEVTETASTTPTPSTTATPLFTGTPTATPSATLTTTTTPTHTATPLYCPTPTAVPDPPPADGDGPPPEIANPCPISITIRTNSDRYWISEQAAMPTDVTASIRVTGVTASTIMDLDFSWSVAVGYLPADFDPVNGPADNVQYAWPSQVSHGFRPFTPDFGPVVRGGTLILTATTTIDDQPYTGRAFVPILGRNPSSNDVLAYFSSQFPSSYYTLWRIAQAESNLRHFTDDGYPKWSSDGYRGVGLMQITSPVPTDDEIWSWKRNADAGSRVLQSAYAIARDWPRTVASSKEFLGAVDAYDAAREGAGLSTIKRVTVPDFTSGNFGCNLLQREQDAVRLYNGAGGSDDLGRPLHEFKLAFDQSQGLLDLVVDEDNSTATAQWVRVPASERPPGSGTANYVDIVLGKPAPVRC